MKEIGGYFELELNRSKTLFHSSGLFLNSGKNALEFVLSSVHNINKLWVPYYTCDIVLDPIKKLNIPYDFYHINENLEISSDIQLNSNDYLLVTNYFGIKDEYIALLAKKYSTQLIVDNAQALFAKPINGIKTIYSPRKFVGIPDGGIAYLYDHYQITDFEREISFHRCGHLLKRIDIGANKGYNEFKENGTELAKQPIRTISNLSATIFSSIDFEMIKQKRRTNFKMLHNTLAKTNKISIPDIGTFECPLVYPLYSDRIDLKKYLINNKIFVATYWPNVLQWCKANDVDYQLAEKVVCIPVDQRYGENEMNYILEKIKCYG